MHAWVAEQNLNMRPRSGVALPIRPDSLTQEHESHATFPL